MLCSLPFLLQTMAWFIAPGGAIVLPGMLLYLELVIAT